MISKQDSNTQKDSAQDQSQPKKNKFDQAHEQIDPELMKKWTYEQTTLRDKFFIEKDDFSWTINSGLKLIGGVDISFSDDNKHACSIVVVLSYPELKLLHEVHEIVELDQPYIPGYLAFREVSHLYKLIQKIKTDKPELTPQCIIVDGNGILHQNGFGLASHLGVLVDIPTIGCGKKVFYCDGIKKDDVKANEKQLKKGGDYIVLKGDSGRNWGAALRSTNDSTNPIIISVGNKITLDTAVQVASKCCKVRVPEPVTMADQKSRVLIKNADLSKAVKNPMIYRCGDQKVETNKDEQKVNQ